MAVAGADEHVSFTTNPFGRGRLGGGIKFLIAVLALTGLFTITYYGIGLLFFVGAASIAVLGKRRGVKRVRYIVTNKRALVVSNKRNDDTIFEECNLEDVNPISMMRKNTQSSTGSLFTVVGDVVFMQESIPKVRFASVLDPDSVVRTVEEIKKSLYVG